MKLLIRTLLAVPLGALLIGLAPAPAVAGDRDHWRARVLDRIEDRIDRRENRRDERIDYGRRDRIEDRLDRREDRYDRRHGPRAGYWSPHRKYRADRRAYRKAYRAKRRALRRAWRTH